MESPRTKSAVLPSSVIEALNMPIKVTSLQAAGETQWWFDARGVDDKLLLASVERSNCTHVVILFGQHTIKSTGKIKVVWVENVQQLSELESSIWILTRDEAVFEQARSAGYKCGLHIEVEDLESEFPRCIEVCERGDDFVVIDIEHATYIPYELLLAKVEGKHTRILRNIPIKGLTGVINTVDQSLNAFSTMEHGIGVLFKTRSIDAIEDLSERLKHRQSSSLKLVRARVEEVQHTGLGHRVCVDTTSLMTAEEGMIVGSTGWGGIFVCSETHYLPHMNLREFRVNAGGVHSYIWGPNNNVMYLSEMKAGSEVLCVDVHGNTRVLTVGRAKIERRPLIKIKCSVSLDQLSPEISKVVEANYIAQAKVTPSGEKLATENLKCVYINTFLQNDWHVRVMGADGKIRHSAMLKIGDELLAHVELPGRHTGLKITEHIFEQ